MGHEIIAVASQSLDLVLVDLVDLIDEELYDKEVKVVIDFSSPNGCVDAINWCLENNTPLVIGTTGLSDDQKKFINKASKIIPIVFAPNMSLSVNVLFAISNLVAKYLPHAEVEIIEAHHRYKKDAPSGTALGIGEAIASGRGQDLAEVAKFGRERHAEDIRNQSDIGFSVIRGGDIVGQHTAMFILDGEELSLSSNITNRKSFASGAILAARFLVEQSEAKLYTMQDVLKFSA